MTHHDAQLLGFSDRPLGTMAVRVEPTVASTEKPGDEAVLRFRDLSVHVAELQEQGEGVFLGTVCRFTGVSQGELALGDRIRFRSSHVFTFTGFDDAPPARTRRPPLNAGRDEKLENRIPPTRTDDPKRRRGSQSLLAIGAAILMGGIGLGYVIGRTSTPTAPSTDHKESARPGLKLDYELRGR